jgi:hypothetical protein
MCRKGARLIRRLEEFAAQLQLGRNTTTFRDVMPDQIVHGCQQHKLEQRTGPEQHNRARRRGRRFHNTAFQCLSLVRFHFGYDPVDLSNFLFCCSFERYFLDCAEPFVDKRVNRTGLGVQLSIHHSVEQLNPLLLFRHTVRQISEIFDEFWFLFDDRLVGLEIELFTGDEIAPVVIFSFIHRHIDIA